MTESPEKIYHIYAKGKCIYHNLSEEKFAEIWDDLHRMVDLLEMNISKSDLDYEELTYHKNLSLNSSY